MDIFDLDSMTNGWFIGNFAPTALTTTDVEVAVKRYKTGDQEKKHFHKIATEVTVVVSGKVEMCEQIFSAGSIIVLRPGEATSFRALEDSINVVVKIPGAIQDKYESD